MGAEAEFNAVQAESVALQAVVIALCRQILEARPELAPAFCAAFDDAERLMQGIAVRIGTDAPREVTVGALGVIEQIRAAIIRDESVCRPGAG